MQLRRLELQAIGPFAGRKVISFDDLSESGLFLMEGPTGSGKSTIIDAIVFGLYGNVAGGADSTNTRLRSLHVGRNVESYVDLIFTLESGTYRVRRTPQYLKEGNTANTPATAKLWRISEAALEESLLDAGEILENRVSDTSIAITNLIGLNREQFVQTIVLPQGKFADFLRLDSGQRTDLLSQIFDMSEYATITAWLKERASLANQNSAAAKSAFVTAVSNTAAALQLGEDDAQELENSAREAALVRQTDSLLDRLQQELEGAQVRVAAAQTAAEQAQEKDEAAARELEVAQSLAMNLRKRRQLLERKGELETRRADIQALEEAIKRAKDAEPVARETNSARQASEELSAARYAWEHAPMEEEFAASLAGKVELEKTTAADFSDLLARGDQREGELRREEGSLAELAGEEDELEREKLEQEEDLAEVSRIASRLDQLQAQAEEIEAERLTTAETITQLRETANRVDGAQAELQSAQDQLARAVQVTELREQEKREEAEDQNCTRQLEAARQAAQETFNLWQASIASELAVSLRTGEACPVCGSVEHPAPAPTERLLASADEVKVANEELEAKRERAKAAQDALAQTRAQIGAYSGVPEVAQAQSHVDNGQRSLREAQQAVADLHAAEQKISEIEKTRKANDSAQKELSAQRAQAVARSESRAKRIEAQTSRLVAKRMGFATIKDRLSAVTAAAEMQRTWNDRLRAVSVAQEDYSQREKDLASALEASPFSSVEHATQAVMHPNQLQAHEAEVENFRQEVRDAERELSTPGIAELTGEEDPRLEEKTQAAQQYHAAALRARDEATSAQDLAANASQQFQRTTQRRTAWQREEETTGPIVRLASLASGGQESLTHIPLETFVLQRRFEQVVAVANEQLSEISRGRYELVRTNEKERGSHQVKTGLQLEIIDHAASGDMQRSTRSLSGGETFFVSISLALALAEVVRAENGGIHLDTLLIDEGFGSLSEDALDQVMRVLQNLTNGGRAVGVVSHVAQMGQMISTRISVQPREDGSSTLTVTA